MEFLICSSRCKILPPSSLCWFLTHLYVTHSAFPLASPACSHLNALCYLPSFFLGIVLCLVVPLLFLGPFRVLEEKTILWDEGQMTPFLRLRLQLKLLDLICQHEVQYLRESQWSRRACHVFSSSLRLCGFFRPHPICAHHTCLFFIDSCASLSSTLICPRCVCLRQFALSYSTAHPVLKPPPDSPSITLRASASSPQPFVPGAYHTSKNTPSNLDHTGPISS